MARNKLTITLADNVLNDVDNYAKKIGFTRSAAITFLISQGLQMAYYPELLQQLIEMEKSKVKDNE